MVRTQWQLSHKSSLWKVLEMRCMSEYDKRTTDHSRRAEIVVKEKREQD